MGPTLVVSLATIVLHPVASLMLLDTRAFIISNTFGSLRDRFAVMAAWVCYQGPELQRVLVGKIHPLPALADSREFFLKRQPLMGIFRLSCN